MSETRSLAVGAFVLGGLALGAAAIIIFGGMHLFSPTVRAVSYFPGSVAGLSVGAPVTFRGVKVGAVSGMALHVRLPDLEAVIPVTLDLDPSLLSFVGDAPAPGDQELRRAVGAGLRAQLVAQSLVTGQLAVDLDFRPGGAPASARPGGQVLEIPAVPSDLQHLKDQVLELNLPRLAAKAEAALTGLQHILDALDGKTGPIADAALQVGADAHATLQASTQAVRALQMDAARTLGHLDQLAVAGRAQLGVSGAKLDDALSRASVVLARVDRLAASLDEASAARSPLRTDLASSLRDLAASAGSLRAFTRDLQASPAGTLLGHAAR